MFGRIVGESNRGILSSKRRVTTKRESIKRVVDEIVLEPECLKQYANLTGTPYRKSAERLRYELSERGKVVRRRRDESYISVAVWKTAAPYRVHVRRKEDGMWGYRLERVDAPGSSTGKGRRRRRTK